MTIKLNGTMGTFEEMKDVYMNIVKDENATAEQHEKAFNNMFTALSEDLTKKIKREAMNEMADGQILSSRGENVLTSEEHKFFNEAVLEGGFKDGSILPKTTQNRIFEDLVRQHPVLTAIGVQDLGPVVRAITSEPTRAYAWKEIFGDITAQVNATFGEENLTQSKITAFGVIPNDMLELGPEWVERYMRELLVDSLATGLEFGFINGRGPAQNEPIGISMDVDAVSGAVTPKVSKGTLTFAPSEFGETVSGELFTVIKDLSVNEKGESVDVAGNVLMMVNPSDAIAVQFRNTVQTHNGQWVTALPYGIEIVESREVPVGKAIFLVKNRYTANLSGNYVLRKFDQTLALQDATLYTIKRFATGKARDNKAAAVYDLNITFPVVPTP